MEHPNSLQEPCRPLRILLADDMPINQKVALNMLQKLGYGADVVSNGIEVLAALDRQSYDVILIDVQMPEMDGLEATRKIRHDYLTQPWLIAMTAHSMQSDRELCLKAGMDDYISKPIRLDTLNQALERFKLSRQGGVTGAVKPTGSDLKRDRCTPVFVAAPLTAPLAAEAFLPVIDARMIYELQKIWGQNANTLLCDLFHAYLEDAPQRLAQIQDAVEREDMVALRHAAHTMKSLTAAIGAVRLVKLCETLEAYGREHQLSAIATVLTQLCIQVDHCEQAAIALLGEIGVSPQ
jgi:CheY-like chemotaxis protein